MASMLTRGISFRRQGSSGSTWTYNEEGVLVRQTKEGSSASVNGSGAAVGSLSRIHHWQGSGDETESSSLGKKLPISSTSMLLRSKSVGCAPGKLLSETPQLPAKTKKSSLLKWLKKTFVKLKN
ncbi:hypothetical protein KP509_04G005400 [Ceratopteris richardii]|uniref:Uncharacterized protein n=1 Tax=Ceratopteris richardii TaxID=49495 RepID=A0A8T2UXJ9_CERRI|nr:hypothetical protein KP509_04G005400 [Ceratopteris richardii]